MKKSIDKFMVILDDPGRIYFPGDQVNGTIKLAVKQGVQIPKLSLECQGEAYVWWPENTGTYTRYYYCRQEYFRVKACVYDQEKLNQDISTNGPPNSYTFSFRFTIPRKVLPPSYESVHGYIRYSMRADIQNKNGKTKIKTGDTFFMIGDYQEYDEDELQILNEQTLIHGQETLAGGSCYPAGSVTLSAYTDNLLYHTGQCVNTSVRVDDERQAAAGTIEVSLVRVTTYRDLKGNTTYSKDSLIAVEQQFQPNDTSTEVMDTQLAIPPGIYPTMQNGCQCINVNYNIQVRLKLGGKTRKEPVVMIPVIIASSSSSSSSSSPSQLTTPQNGHPNYDQVSVGASGTLFFFTGSPLGNQDPLPNWCLPKNRLHEKQRDLSSAVSESSTGFYALKQ